MERTVMVTGAGSGLGLATAVRLADLGFRVVGVVPDQLGVDALETAAAGGGVSVEVAVADLAEPDRRGELVEGRTLFALVNSAGYPNAGLLGDIADHEARQQLEAMVIAPMDLCRRALPAMLRRGEGRIVNVTSTVHTSTPFTGWYRACQAALRELTEALRLELADTDLVVLDVEPDGLATDIWPRARIELARRRLSSTRPEAYDRPLAVVERYQSTWGDTNRVADVIGSALTTSHPRPHLRVGLEVTPRRVLSEVLPDRLWERFISRAGAA
jgi:NAD(P)-dependent dehydrogenase (short-subunit alcohol dehydrogenase family)